MSKVQKFSPIKLSEDVFKYYYFLQLPMEEKGANTGLLVDDGCLEFVFLKETNVQLRIGDGSIIDLPQSAAFGEVSVPMKYIYADSITMLAIKIQPWATSIFFKGYEIGITDLSKIFGDGIHELHQNIFQSNTNEQMVAHFEEYFVNFYINRSDEFKICKKICEDIYKSAGMVKVKDLISQFPYSRQKVNNIFFRVTRKSIKQFAVCVRVRAIMEYKVQHPEESLTEVAYRFGYFDQSHFVRDIKKATGVPPSTFLANENFFIIQLNSRT